MSTHKNNHTRVQPKRYPHYSRQNKRFRMVVFFLVIGLSVFYLVLRTPIADDPTRASGYVPVNISPRLKGDFSSLQVKKVPTVPALSSSLPETVNVSPLKLPQFHSFSLSPPNIDSSRLRTDSYSALTSIPKIVSPPPINPSFYPLPSTGITRFSAPTWNSSHLSSVAQFSSRFTPPALNPSHYNSLTNITPRYVQPVQIPPAVIGR